MKIILEYIYLRLLGGYTYSYETDVANYLYHYNLTKAKEKNMKVTLEDIAKAAKVS